MPLKHFVLGLAIAATMPTAFETAQAADGLYVPLFTYRHAADVEGGFDKIKGKQIGLVYLDVPYGKEPIPLLQALAQDYGFELKLYAVPVPQMQNQSSLWLDIRRCRQGQEPDHLEG